MRNDHITSPAPHEAFIFFTFIPKSDELIEHSYPSCGRWYTKGPGAGIRRLPLNSQRDCQRSGIYNSLNIGVGTFCMTSHYPQTASRKKNGSLGLPVCVDSSLRYQAAFGHDLCHPPVAAGGTPTAACPSASLGCDWSTLTHLSHPPEAPAPITGETPLHSMWDLELPCTTAVHDVRRM